MSNCHSKYLHTEDIVNVLRNLIKYHSTHKTVKKLVLNDLRYLLNIYRTSNSDVTDNKNTICKKSIRKQSIRKKIKRKIDSYLIKTCH